MQTVACIFLEVARRVGSLRLLLVWSEQIDFLEKIGLDWDELIYMSFDFRSNRIRSDRIRLI
jgi:hypothetical protein